MSRTRLIVRLSAVLCLAAFVPAQADAADEHEVIAKLNSARSFDTAVKKCDKWNASSINANPALREACAEAEWDFARRESTVEGWARYGERWKGTAYEAKALEQEAQKALIALGVKATEDQFDALVQKYQGTKTAADAKVKAAYAAFRTVQTGEDAFRVVGKYPEHEDAANVTQKYLDAFVSVEFKGEQFEVKLDPAAVIPEGKEMKSNWVARYPDGSFTSWGEEAKRQLIASGLPEDFVAAAAGKAEEGEPPLPLCFDPNAPDGWQAGVMVSLGRGSAFVAAPWDDACSDDTWPIFLTVAKEKVTGMSMRPGHMLYFPAEVGSDKGYKWGDQEYPTRMYVPFEPGTPMLVGNLIGQPLGRTIYLVHPTAGGMPWWWLTTKPPPGDSLRLTPDLRGSALHKDWKVSSSGAGSVITGGALDGKAWTLPPGEVRAVSPLMQQLTGLKYTDVSLVNDSDPLPSPGKSVWTLPERPDPTAENAAANGATGMGPQNSGDLEMVAVPEGELAGEVSALSRAGMAVEAKRGWRLQLDDDGAQEVLIEAVVDGVGVRFLLDPPDRGINRVYAFDVGTASDFESGTSAVFGFKRAGRPYLGIVSPRSPSGAEIGAYHFGDTSLMREYFTVPHWGGS